MQVHSLGFNDVSTVEDLSVSALYNVLTQLYDSICVDVDVLVREACDR